MANSYNELHNIGSQHSEDANSEFGLLCNDNAANGTIADYTSNGRDFTMLSGTTATISTTGPNSYLTSALDFSSGSYWARLLSPVISSSTNATVACWINTTIGNAGSGRPWYTERATNGVSIWKMDAINGSISSNSHFITHRDGSSTLTQAAPATKPTLNDGNWHRVVYIKTGTSVEFVADGTSNGSITLNGTDTMSGTIYAGLARDPYDSGSRSYAKQAHMVAFSRNWTSTECDEDYGGPEPIYVSGASLSDAGAFNVGSWDLGGPFSGGTNGTLNYQVIAVNAAGTVLDSTSGSSTTGTLDLSANAGNVCYLLVRTTNTGGADIGDYSTRTSGYGSANDGYYELTSVTAAGGGGGGPTIPVFYHHYKQLQAA